MAEAVNIRIADILRGCSPGRIQSVGYMQVIPLISEMHYDGYRVPRPEEVSNPSYGHLVFENKGNEDVIVPAQMACITKQSAQYHAMTQAGVVLKKSRSQFSTAVCVQETQPGNIRASADNKLVVLPLPLREPAYRLRSVGDLGRLWPEIRRFVKRVKAGERGNVVDFLNKFERQLDEFVAEFEPVPNQVGAVVLVNGKVVGVERAPNPKYWADVWRMLIRECYGAYAIVEAEENKQKGAVVAPQTRVPIREAKDLADLRDALNEANDREYRRVAELVNAICETEASGRVEQKAGDLHVDTFGDDMNARFIGQVVRDGAKVVYASMVATETWKRNEDWFTAKPFRM